MEELGYPENITGKCQKQAIFFHTLPYWNISGINFPLKPSSLCKNSLDCNEPVDMSPELINTWDGVNKSVGVQFKYFCSINTTRGRIAQSVTKILLHSEMYHRNSLFYNRK